MESKFRSWGIVPTDPQNTIQPAWLSELPTLFDGNAHTLAVGNGRSYGDSCLLKNHSLIEMTGLNRLIHFDTASGVIQVEAGVKLCDLLKVIVPKGWFLPVTPGTSYITVGGAVANDVHGKNHHNDGTFGCFVRRFELLRSDGSLNTCTASENSELYCATIGGLGLTGVITQVELQLIPINSSYLDVRYDAFHSLTEFAELSQAMKLDWKYTVAWMDCATQGTAGRGVLMSANHSNDGELSIGAAQPKLSVPFNCPSFLLNRYSIQAFNAAYFKAQSRKTSVRQNEHFQPYFYPLDAIGHWNRIYGKQGFHQYQFSVPLDALPVLSDILNLIISSQMGSFLAVLKEFGSIPSSGLMSFPRPGYCLALDFSQRGNKTMQFINQIDQQVRQAGGAAYPAKDKLMSEEAFKQYFPQWELFQKYIDPACSSDFWRRVSGTVVGGTQGSEKI